MASGEESLEELRKALRAQQKRAEEAEQRAEAADLAHQRERERAEAADLAHQRERERAEAADLAHQRERERAEAADLARQQERERADAADLARQQERARAEAAVEQNRPTTLDEYISSCHTLVFSNLVVETNKSLTTKSSATSPRNKWCPTNLRPWPEFLEQQRSTYSTLYEVFPSDLQAFQSRGFLAGLGEIFSTWRIADHKRLESFLHLSVEEPVKRIISELKDIEEARGVFNLSNGIIFENHPHAISDLNEEVIYNESLSAPSPPSTPGQPHRLNQLQADQICIYRSDDEETRAMIYVCEYKPPHQLTTAHLRRGLHPMDIHKDVVNRKKNPEEDDDASFQSSAEKLVASAITQTYHYMIEGGLDYGLLTTGEAIVFLKIDWREPETLFYHLAEPAAEASAHPDHFHLCTAVSQYLAFTLTALESFPEGQHGQGERHRVMQILKTWSEDFESVLRSIPDSDRRAPGSGDDYKPEVYEGFDRSPYMLRGNRRPRRGSDPRRENLHSRHQEDSSDDDEPRIPESPSPTARRSRQRQSGAPQATRRSQRTLAHRTRGGADKRQDATETQRSGGMYCTQKCLLGLVNGGPVDHSCPNVAMHGGPSAGNDGHLISHAEFLKRLWAQLEESLDDGIWRLGIGGARGVLFKVTLLEFGYTFVSKGTVRAFVKDLEHEAAVYERLKPLQGIHVPVFLGAIDLRSMGKTYYYDHRVYIIHMSFLSWGGSRLSPSSGVELREKVKLSLQAIHENGVAHRDVREPNMLFNAETDGVMVIDFERAVLVQQPRPPLALMTSPNKRRRMMASSAKQNCLKQRDFFTEDTRAISSLFRERS